MQRDCIELLRPDVRATVLPWQQAQKQEAAQSLEQYKKEASTVMASTSEADLS